VRALRQRLVDEDRRLVSCKCDASKLSDAISTHSA
jgi:hypothetical protein